MKQKVSGFTLIELAIVLVIIGLLVGGVLQGQELIKQAQIRNTLAELREYDTAVNTFRSKYSNGLPGDFNRNTTFGINLNSSGTNNFTTTVNSGTTYDGDGDGQLESSTATTCCSGAASFNGEVNNFFISLSNINLVKGSFSALSGTADADSEFPGTAIGSGMVAISYNGSLYYLLGLYNGFTAASGLTTAASATSGASVLGLTLSVDEAYSIDSKLDDGLPNTGSTRSISQYNGTSAVFSASATGSGACNTASNAAYNFITPSGNNATKKCSLSIRASS